MTSESVLDVSLDAIKHNAELFRRQLGGVIPILKANAYGVGLEAMAAHFLGSGNYPWIGLAHVSEAARARQGGYTGRIFLIHCLPEEVPEALSHNAEIAISSKAVAKALIQHAQYQKTPCHLYINTGMNRFGLDPTEALQVAKIVHGEKKLNIVSILTHPSAAESPQSDDHTKEQLQTFHSVLEKIQSANISYTFSHIANTAFACRFPMPQHPVGRIGLGLFGHTSSTHCHIPGIRPALKLTCPIVHIRSCPQGQSIGYNHLYRVQKRDEAIAVIPLGYADGFHVSFSGKSTVSVRGKPAAMVGRICMDFSMINITDIPEARVGDEVTIFGGGALSLTEQAKNLGAVPHELVSCLGPRVTRRIKPLIAP